MEKFEKVREVCKRCVTKFVVFQLAIGMFAFWLNGSLAYAADEVVANKEAEITVYK